MVFAEHYPTFFRILPLKYASYTAAYKEQEVYAALHGYLDEAAGGSHPPSVRLLIAEFIRHIIERVAINIHQCWIRPAFDYIVMKGSTGQII